MKTYVIILPCFNENKALIQLLEEIENLFVEINTFLQIVVVDDCSNDETTELVKGFKFKAQNIKLDILVLNYNMGHQEAIRQGLGFVHNKQILADGFIVMDSDGEDDPKALLDLIALENFEIIFIERGKRYEGIGFKIGYFLYKHLFSLVVGKKITFGNFSMINQQILGIVVSQKFLHYSSFLYKQNRKVQKLKFDRRQRISGISKMNQKRLIFHGLYSILEFSEEILYFLLKLSVVFFLVDVVCACVILYKKFYSNEAILGWTSLSLFNLTIITLLLFCTLILGLILVSFKKITLLKNDQYKKF